MKATINIMKDDERRDYDQVKTQLEKNFRIQPETLGECFWKATKPKDSTYINIRPTWKRLLQRYVGEGSTKKEVLDIILREKIIQDLPPAAAVYAVADPGGFLRFLETGD